MKTRLFPAAGSRFTIRRRLAALAVTATVAVGAFGGVVDAAPPPSNPLADGLAGPLAIDVTFGGKVLVSQSFGGVVSSISRRGVVTDLFAEQGVAAVAGVGLGRVRYTVVGEDGSSLLKERDRHGQTRTIADLGAYEATANPDQINTYGFENITPACAQEWAAVEEFFGPPQYSGIVESNPYKIAHTIFGTYVADAAANAVLFVDRRGRVSTVAVLPPQPLVVPEDFAEANGIPSCAGLTYAFEPVPTDVEVHRHKLYVSTLAGGPEDPSLGARSSVYRISPRTGAVDRIATGLLGATDLAVSPFGKVYVTELFGGRVSRLAGSNVATVVELPSPAAVEWARGRLYVAYDVFESGKVGTFQR